MRRRLIAAALPLILLAGAAHAADYNHRPRNRHRASQVGNGITKQESALAARRGYCREDTADGPIIIACGLARQMSGFIADVVARGFHGRIHCFSTSRSHVRHSLHFIAQACDFAQHGWGKTVRLMHHVAGLAAKWGLRDGCSFHRRRGPDCGHIDSGDIKGKTVRTADQRAYPPG